MSRTIKPLLSIYLVVFFVGLTGLLLIISLSSPGDSSIIVFTALYLSLFISAFGLVALLAVIFKSVFGSRAALYRNNKVTLRQASLLALLVTIGFFLQSLRLLNLTTGILLAVTISVLELYFLNK